MENLRFISNWCVTKGNMGAGIFISEAKNLSLTDSLFKNNTAVEGGAVYLIEIEDMIMTNLTFNNNKAMNKGGGMQVKLSDKINVKDL